MFVLADAFRRTEAPLTASVQMLPQTMQDVTIELVEGSAWKAEAEVVRPPSAVPVQFRNQPRQRLETVPPLHHLMQDCPFPLLSLSEGNRFQYHLRRPNRFRSHRNVYPNESRLALVLGARRGRLFRQLLTLLFRADPNH